MISQTQCMRPRVSVEPMYMPGRLRTASSPSRTRRCAALYEVSVGAATNVLSHHDSVTARAPAGASRPDAKPTRDTPAITQGTPAVAGVVPGLAWAGQI